MGMRAHTDGRCIICKMHSYYFCDHCTRYICMEHAVKIHIEINHKYFIMCPDCANAGKKPVTTKRKYADPKTDYYDVEY